jgi:hypothetical protein
MCLAAALAAQTAAQQTQPSSSQDIKRFAGRNYTLAFHSDGQVDLLARQGKHEFLLGSVGAFTFPTYNHAEWTGLLD